VNARRTGRRPSRVLTDISNPYRSMPVMDAALTSVAFEKALQCSTNALAWSAFMCAMDSRPFFHGFPLVNINQS
jgi:hypothetical protein